MPNLIENIMYAVGEKSDIEKVTEQLAEFRLMDAHLETVNYWVAPYKTKVKVKGFDKEYLELKAHFQSWGTPLLSYHSMDPELAGLHAYMFRPSNNYLGSWADGGWRNGKSLVDPEGILDVFNNCYTIGLSDADMESGKPLYVVRSELGLLFELNSNATGGLNHA